MVVLENLQVIGFDGALRGMRNPKDSWKRSDSHYADGRFIIGENDKGLMLRLAKAGSEHRKYLRMIHVQFDLTLPIYVWSEMDTYKVGVTRDSRSFMHKGMVKEFELSDFTYNEEMIDSLKDVIKDLNKLREKYLETKDFEVFVAIRDLLPSGYNLKATLDMNYENILNIYRQRYNHRLKEWRDLCEMFKEQVPLMSDIIDSING